MHDQAFDDAPGHESVGNFVDVRRGHATVGHMRRLLNHGRADFAQIQTTGTAGPYGFDSPAFDEGVLQQCDELFRALLGAGTLGVALLTAICANE